jgi:Uma2 family endonuclease
MSTIAIPEPKLSSTDSVITDDDLYEIIDGKRVRTPPMGVFAVWIASEILSHLSVFARTKNLGRALAEALFHLPAPINRDRRPDVAFVSYQRWAKSRPIPPTDNAWDVVPNLATEVVSPTDIAEDLELKIDEYFRAGVQLVWVVFPMQKKIHVYSSPKQITVLLQNEALDGGTVVPGFHLVLAELFTEPTETPTAANGQETANTGG